MTGTRQEAQAVLFHEVSLADHVRQDHLLRSTDRFADLVSIRTLSVGFCFGIRPERRLCDVVHLNLGYQ